MARGDNARLSESSYGGESKKSRYPFNDVYQSPSGHQLHVDNTPNGERIYFQHARGTYVEINMDGNMVTMSIGDNVEYNKSGKTVTTDENSDCKTHGHCRTITGGAIFAETLGDTGEGTGGNYAISVMGNANIRAKHVSLASDANVAINALGNMHFKVSGDMLTEVQGTYTLKGAKVTINPGGGATPGFAVADQGFGGGGSSGGGGIIT